MLVKNCVSCSPVQLLKGIEMTTQIIEMMCSIYFYDLALGKCLYSLKTKFRLEAEGSRTERSKVKNKHCLYGL